LNSLRVDDTANIGQLAIHLGLVKKESYEIHVIRVF